MTKDSRCCEKIQMMLWNSWREGDKSLRGGSEKGNCLAEIIFQKKSLQCKINQQRGCKFDLINAGNGRV